jgi:Holliday junction resolvasome RuvABC endonuclease subunit
LFTINREPILVSHGHIKPLDSRSNIFVRLQDAYEKISNLCQDINPTHVAIEDIVFYMKGRSSAKTISTLAVFNRIIGTCVYMHTGIIPKLMSVGTIRKLIRDTCPRVNSQFKKEEIPEIIRNNLEPEFHNIINRNGNISNETYDEADGIAVAWAYSIELGRQNGSS